MFCIVAVLMILRVYTLSQHAKDFPGGPVIGDPHASEGVGGGVCACMLSPVQLCNPMEPIRLLCPWKWVAISFSRGSS